MFFCYNQLIEWFNFLKFQSYDPIMRKWEDIINCSKIPSIISMTLYIREQRYNFYCSIIELYDYNWYSSSMFSLFGYINCDCFHKNWLCCKFIHSMSRWKDKKWVMKRKHYILIITLDVNLWNIFQQPPFWCFHIIFCRC